MNVYGSEVTEATVKRQPGYHKDKTITRQDVANLALEMKNDEGKLERARGYLKGLEDDYGHFNAAATKCLIYNATGATIKYNTHNDFQGHVGESSYPDEIKNGQWGVFFHHKPPIIPSGSKGAVAYYLKNEFPHSDTLAVLGWVTTWAAYDNNCYAEMVTNVEEEDYFKNFFQTMFDLNKSRWTTTHGRLQAELTIGADSVCEWTAIIKLVPQVENPS